MKELLLIVAFDTQTEDPDNVAVWEYDGESRFENIKLSDEGFWGDRSCPGMDPVMQLSREDFTLEYGRRALAPGTKKVMSALLTWEWRDN